MNENLLKEKTKEIGMMLKECGVSYLDVCFCEGSIMITDAEKTYIYSSDGGETWRKR